jgi:vibriolysin
MRISRLASIAPLLLIWAGCSVSPGDSTDPQGESGIFVAGDESSLRLADELALQHIAERPEIVLGAGEVASRLTNIDEFGAAHARVSQTINGVPVFGAEAIIHMGPDGAFESVTDKLIRGIDVNTTPRLRDAEAVDLAVAGMGGAHALMGERKPAVDLQILRHEGTDHLTFRVQLEMRTEDDEPTMPVVFVDAHTGEIVWSYDNLETAKNRQTYTAKNRTTLPGTLLRSEGQAQVADATANQAHDNAGLTYDYYSSRHGRDSYDGVGATIKSSVHYSKNYVNAFWNGTQMVYGDGDGVQSNALTVLDVVGHELTHAVTEKSSNLTYANESGALNEAMSDIFGASIEAYRDGAITANTWKIGEECWTPGTAGDALRYMNDPALAGDYDYYPTRYTGTSDNGGVHWNSGIANLAFYLMTAGGTHPRGKTSNAVPALSSNSLTSMQMAAAIFYRANTTCLTPGSTFTDARDCTQQAASFLYGATAANSVTQAWIAVGVPAPLSWSVIDSKSSLSAGNNNQTTYTYTKPAGATAMKFSTSGGTGDADLYVRFGSPPTTNNYDCISAGANNNESCTINPAQSGTYYVMVHAYAAYSGMSFTASSGQ